MGQVPLARPVAWTPPPVLSLKHEWRINEGLEQAELWPVPHGRGPEDVEVDAAGRVYTGVDDGRVLVFEPDGHAETVTHIAGGRPLGLALEADERSLIVCDSRLGRLLRLDLATGRHDVLLAEVDGRPLGFVNNPAVAGAGIYFSESSIDFRQDNWRNALLQHALTGSVYRFDPADGRVDRLLNQLSFANGVEVSADENYMVVADTGRYCIWKLWLAGPLAGRHELLVPNLPGFPDNISRAPNGNFWVAIAAPRERIVDVLLPHPSLRRPVVRLAQRLPVRVKRRSLVAEFDGEGRLVRQLQSPSGRCWYVTGARQRGGRLYLGSLEMGAVAWVDLP